MIEWIKLKTPRSLREKLRPYYKQIRQRIRRRNNTLLRRDWELDIDVPDPNRRDFIQSVMMGTLDYPVKNEYTNVLLCAQPKSASLYLTQFLALCFDFKNHQIGFDKKGGEIYYPRLIAAKFRRENTISHCHALPRPNILKMIELLNLRPLILTRNLLDALVSRRDMLLRDRWAPEILSQKAITDFIKGSTEYQMDIIIDLFAGSYINFYAGWDQIRNDKGLMPIYITYEELIEDEIALVQRVANELDVSISDRLIKDISSKIAVAGGINYSIGVSGRGTSAINDRQLATLKQTAHRLGCYEEKFLGFKP